MTISNLLSTNVVVSILVSAYRHQQRVDTPTEYTLYSMHTIVQATYNKHEVPNGPFSHSWSHIV